MNINIDNKFNIILYPKCGSSYMLKILSEYFGYFESHSHSYLNNTCLKYNIIRTCAANMLDFSKLINKPRFHIIRSHKYRILSYYLSNYNDNLSFFNFVMEIYNNNLNTDGHLLEYFKNKIVT
jgi:hypothetical protein